MRNILFISLLFLGFFGYNINNDSSQTKVLVIASEKRDCAGGGYKECFIIKNNGEGNWQYFYDQIEGFDYEPGIEYIVELSVERIENPPMDASSLKYTLLKIISRTQKDSEDLP